jgi:hypothetical protein
MTSTQKLKLTPAEYENMLFGAYARWCESVTINAREFQKVIANSAVNKWYLIEYAKCEAEFQQLTGRYENLTAQDYKRCYNDCTFRMFNIRPTALLEAIKKTPNVNNPRVPGIKMFNAINQN